VKSIGIIEKLKGLSKQELVLLGVILSIFLPFYIFVIIFIAYLIGLIFTGEMKGILKYRTGIQLALKLILIKIYSITLVWSYCFTMILFELMNIGI